MKSFIYGIHSLEEAQKVLSLGADYVGFNLEEFDHKILSEITAPIAQNTIITIHAHQLEDLDEQIRHLFCSIVHLGAHPDKLFPSVLQRLKNRFPEFQFAQVIPVIDRYSIDIAKHFDNLADYLFLDSFSFQSQRLGVTGKTHDWGISAEIVKSCHTPVILAGGLGPDNVSSAIKAVLPYGVATKTRTDLPDSSAKDMDKVSSFISQAKNN